MFPVKGQGFDPLGPLQFKICRGTCFWIIYLLLHCIAGLLAYNRYPKYSLHCIQIVKEGLLPVSTAPIGLFGPRDHHLLNRKAGTGGQWETASWAKTDIACETKARSFVTVVCPAHAGLGKNLGSFDCLLMKRLMSHDLTTINKFDCVT